MDEQEWDACGDQEKMLDFLQGTGRASSRKLLLFAVGVCRRLHYLLSRDYTRACLPALEVWERYVDGLATDEDLGSARSNAVTGVFDARHAIAHPGEADCYAVSYAAQAVAQIYADDAGDVARAAARAAAYEAVTRFAGDTLAAIASSWEGRQWGEIMWQAEEGVVRGTPCYTAAHAAERNAQADLLRDIFGPLPFRPLPTLPPSVRTWNGGVIQRLAEAAFEHRLLPSGQLDTERLGVLADALEEAGADAEMVEHLRGPGPHVRGCHVVDALTGRE